MAIDPFWPLFWLGDEDRFRPRFGVGIIEQRPFGNRVQSGPLRKLSLGALDCFHQAWWPLALLCKTFAQAHVNGLHFPRYEYLHVPSYSPMSDEGENVAAEADGE